MTIEVISIQAAPVFYAMNASDIVPWSTWAWSKFSKNSTMWITTSPASNARLRSWTTVSGRRGETAHACQRVVARCSFASLLIRSRRPALSNRTYTVIRLGSKFESQIDIIHPSMAYSAARTKLKCRTSADTRPRVSNNADAGAHALEPSSSRVDHHTTLRPTSKHESCDVSNKLRSIIIW